MTTMNQLVHNVLVLTQAYPSYENRYAMTYVHTRALQYMKAGITVRVVCFGAKTPYVYEGVEVNPEWRGAALLKQGFSRVLVHAPNIRNHIRFLTRHSKAIEQIIIWIHGHEVLLRTKDYPKPYSWNRKMLFFRVVDDIYDLLKLRLFSLYLSSVRDRVSLVFVSEWLRTKYMQRVRPDFNGIRNVIIHNPVGELFMTTHYDVRSEKKFDFITIRPLDGANYCVDLVCKLAANNPKNKFLIVGQGRYFSHEVRPENVTWWDRFLSHEEIVDALNDAGCALMPTRHDTQGVTACEMATFGIPVITSKIEVCQEMLAGFENVAFVDNAFWGDTDMERVLPPASPTKSKKFFPQETTAREIDLISGLDHKSGQDQV